MERIREPLQEEHQTIRRAVGTIEALVERVQEASQLDPVAVDFAVDFMRTYAGRIHIEKEETLLFPALLTHKLQPEQRQVIKDLHEAHEYGLALIDQLGDANRNYLRHGQFVGAIVFQLSALVNFFPQHLAQEERELLPLIDHYLHPKEERTLLAAFHEHDRHAIHERYREALQRLEHTQVEA
jgi:hemerythrin-like domain-containing protein